tara:strand:+ start:12 stop:3683 length:3672 start_codon:yes stop_codon:yes gene_type:complete
MEQPPNNTNTILIDANRRNSAESISGNNTNPAQWTNEASAGIKLNVGDKVSVHSSFISEIGCGDQALETSGKPLTTEASFDYTEIVPEIGEKRYEYGPYSARSVEVKPVNKSMLPRDNEMRFTLSYYKNANGENYIHLPRRFDTDQIVTDDGLYQRPYTDNANKVYAPSNPEKLATEFPHRDPNRNGDGYYLTTHTKRQKTWWQDDSFTSGQGAILPQYRCPADWHFYIGKAGYTGWSEKHNAGTYATGDSSGGSNADERVAMAFKLAENVKAKNFDPGPTLKGSRGYDVNEWRPRNDNSRFSIFMMRKTVYDSTTAHPTNFVPFDDLEPCNHNYIKYIELKEYNIKTGFNDPNNVAYQLTSQITDKSEPETIYLNQYLNANGVAAVQPRYDCPISMAITGETFKPFACSNWATIGKTQFDAYVADGTAQTSIDYLSSYQTIGVKRPDFFIAGRNMFNHYFADPKEPTNTELKNWTNFRIGEPPDDKNFYPENAADAATKVWMPTTIPYTSDNLSSISAFLKTQALYPELLVFDKRNQNKTTIPAGDPVVTTDDMPYFVDTPPSTPSLVTNVAGVTSGIDNPVDEKRFLHMSGRKEGGDVALPLVGPALGRIGFFGDDGYVAPTLPVANTNLAASQPVFFHYDKRNENKDETIVSGLNENELVYGFAGRYEDALGNSYIRLYMKDGLSTQYTTEKFGGDPGDGYVYERAIGYDRHFNAYGNSAMILYSGQLPETFDGLSRLNAPKINGGSTTAENGQSWDISKYIRQVYLGAIQPLINFDTAQSRFTIGGLHTPEYIQNDADAGKLTTQPTPTDPSGLPIAVTGDAGTSVYKINKILQSGNNWTPNMNPYKSKTDFTCPLNGIGHVFDSTQLSGVTGITRSNTVSTFSGYQSTLRRYMFYDGAEAGVNPIPGAAWGGPGPQPATVPGPITGTSSNVSPQQELIEANRNLDSFTVFDSQCGVALEAYGIAETDWEQSIWGIMGWSYNQLAKTSQPVYTIQGGSIGGLNRQARLTRTNSGLIKGLTTNADIGLNDIPLYNKNVWDKSMYTLQMPTPEEPNVWFGYNTTSTTPFESGGADFPKSNLTTMIDDVNMPNIYPNIVVPQNTALIVAEGLPIKMSSPYYLIKSNIIADSFYIRDTTPLPIVSVVNKENGFGDFYFQGPSQLEFTITQPITLTFILTEIYDSDMTFARVDKNSAVIYKIEKAVPSNINIVDQVIQATKNKK